MVKETKILRVLRGILKLIKDRCVGKLVFQIKCYSEIMMINYMPLEGNIVNCCTI